MTELVKEGKTRFISLSECSAESLRRGSAVHPLASLQMEYSLFSRDAEEQGQIDACKELSMAMMMMAYAVLGRGMLSAEVPKVEELAKRMTFAQRSHALRSPTPRKTGGYVRRWTPSRAGRALRSPSYRLLGQWRAAAPSRERRRTRVAKPAGGKRSSLSLNDQVLALANGKTQQEITAACKGARPNHVGAALARQKRAGRIEEREGRLYATQSTETT
jgi:hypothetical protein